MANRLVEFFRQQQPQSAADAQALAAGLTQQAAAPRGTFAGYQGSVMPSFSVGEGLGQLGQALLARRAGKKAKEMDAQERQAIAAQLRGMAQDPRQAAAVGAITELPLPMQQQVAANLAMGQLSPTIGGQSPTKVQEYERAKADGYTGTFERFLNDFYGREQNTPASLQEWEAYKAMTPDEQARYIEMKRSLQIPTINQVPTQVLPGGELNPLSTLEDTTDAAEKLAGAQAAGAAAGQNQGAIDAKKPALDSLSYVVDRFYGVLGKTPTGGVMGYKGRIGGVTDYQDAREFDNLREQLSTELRTVFRIPGEGTLSDREQAQYGLQLPDRLNDESVNRQILDDLMSRSELRLRVGEGYVPGHTPVIPNSATPRPQNGNTVSWGDLQ